MKICDIFENFVISIEALFVLICLFIMTNDELSYFIVKIEIENNVFIASR